ncbi:MAG: ABC transporter ATP-binding protein [Candidatus Krumholzibacteria bacterium]|jgi:ABC-2 type transport system ATP-binding protein|nr:ABC transporter ATP-binding protein [Candidatus Krumholzibacteria bacterium]
MIEINDLTKYYGDLCALDHVSLTIEKGKILGLLGPNGAGKTTAMRILTGYLSPTSGTVVAKGLSISDKMLEIKKMIGYLPESAPLYQDMLVFDYLSYVAEIRGLGREEMISRIKELSEICGLREVMHRSIHELSKGYKQRVGLAHAMMSDPEILVLDEPTSGLDPNQIVEIRDIIRKIGREKTVILSTHILSEVEATCDRVVIINRGRIVADGSTEELRKSSESEYFLSMKLRGADERKAMEILSAVGGVRETLVEDRAGGDLSLRLLCGTSEDIREKIYRRIRETDWVLLEYRQESKSLEKIFRELTKEN